MTTENPDRPPLGNALLAAALLLPGLAAQAEEPPERSTLSVKYLNYEESQSGLDRVHVDSPSVSLVTPIAGAWSLAGSLTSDHVSGASPRYHTAISGASRMKDTRRAGDIAITRYLPNGSVTVGAAYSTEHDYVSRALSLTGTVSSADKNTTWSFGIGGSDDAIDPVNLIVSGESRQTVNVMAGVTQVLTPHDIAQLTLTRTQGHGYYSDPYKMLDNRPRERNQNTLLARWNHYHEGSGGTTRLSYRYYTDTFGIRAHTLGAEHVLPLADGWRITPSVRYHTQRAASFYFDPVYDATLGAPFPPGYVFGGTQFSSADQRLSGFGAVTLGIKVAKEIGRYWTVDLKVEAYQQRGAWRAFANGSPGLDAMRARSIQLGLTRQW
ncbi:DUF3570 domain-containing protein [Pseudoduganella sp. UC29_71]|uniref:DUF3570 domain-containing protein n=1 Tax=Pseudoduganella sp. UC29_71 TaxID=3350174 RepID=UPI00366B378A